MKTQIVLLLLMLISSFPRELGAQEFDLYSIQYYDPYRQIGYWAGKSISVSDYDYNSGDARYLGLSVASADATSYFDDASPQLVNHFNLEFDRLIRGTFAFYDSHEGWNERFQKLYEKYGKQENFGEIIDAQESARRRALYGPNPAAIYCNISVTRRDFPVLFEITCRIVATEDLSNRNGLEERRLGYGSPEYMIGELKLAITEELQKLSETLKKIRTSKKLP